MNLVKDNAVVSTNCESFVIRIKCFMALHTWSIRSKFSCETNDNSPVCPWMT